MKELIDAIVWFAKDVAEGFRNARHNRELDRQIEAVRQGLHEDGEVVTLTDRDIDRIIKFGKCRGSVIGDHEEAS